MILTRSNVYFRNNPSLMNKRNGLLKNTLSNVIKRIKMFLKSIEKGDGIVENKQVGKKKG